MFSLDPVFSLLLSLLSTFSPFSLLPDPPQSPSPLPLVKASFLLFFFLFSSSLIQPPYLLSSSKFSTVSPSTASHLIYPSTSLPLRIRATLRYPPDHPIDARLPLHQTSVSSLHHNECPSSARVPARRVAGTTRCVMLLAMATAAFPLIATFHAAFAHDRCSTRNF